MNTILGLLIDWVLALALWVEQWVTPRLLSKTGRDNPRVRHIVGGLGYYARAYRATLPNVRKWLASRAELFPAVLQVQTINRCNARCPMCPYPHTIHLQEREVMEDALYSKIVAECAGETDLLDFVPMSKNEPLLDVKLEARIAEFKAVAAPHQMVEIVTNGSGLTPGRFNRLAESGVDLITISMSAHTEATYGKVMAGLSWRQVMKNLGALATTDIPNVNIFLRFIRQQDNVSELKAFTKSWRKFNILAF
ncbi:MAG: radical SAM protein, partial [Chloroflexota bacterium]